MTSPLTSKPMVRNTDYPNTPARFPQGSCLLRSFICQTMMGLLAGAITSALASSPEGNSALEVIKALKINSGTITLVNKDSSPSVPALHGKVINNVPPRTIVRLALNPAKGSNINVEIWLPEPENWNGRLLGLGNGGAAGAIHPDSLAGALSTGYAAATTDLGTAPAPESGIGNPEVWKDFGFRATHLMTLSAKQVIKAYYGRDADHSYFEGSSTGGQQALQEAQRYPDDYDGIVAKIPAHCRTPLHAYFLWNDQILSRRPFTASQQHNVIAAGNEYMAAREIPAVAGKFISDPRANSKDVESVIGLAMQKDPTLTKEHAEALRKLFAGPRDTVTGERIFCGIPFGSSFDIARGNLYLFKWVFGANKDLMEVNFGKDIHTYTATLGPYLNAENTDLKRFAQHGGKLIMIVGSADSCVPYHASLDYYDRVIERFGTTEKVQSFFMFYIIPGMSHGPGPGINSLPSILSLVVDWREKGVAPGMIRGQRIIGGKSELEIPIYPYPTKTSWDDKVGKFVPTDGSHGGVERVAERFRPPAEE